MAGPPGPVARVRSALRTFLGHRLAAGEVARDDLILIACSGGPDSLALAAAAAFVAPRLGLRVGAVHVDHGLQPGSAEVAEQTVAACAALGLAPSLAVRPAHPGEAELVAPGGPHTPVATDVPAATDRPDLPGTPGPGGPPAPGGPEARARTLRYTALEATRQEQRACAVVLGHTQDDQAETVLLALARGSGTRAIAGMAPVRGRLWRPLLSVTRADTEAMCRDAELPAWHDPTNALDGPWRTADGGPLPRAAIRHRVLPALQEVLGPGVRAALSRTAEQARDDADHLDALAEQVWTRAAVTTTAPVQLEAAVLTAQPPALRRRVLHRAALAAGSPAGALGSVHVRRLEALVTDWHGQGPVHLPGGLEGVRECGRLVLRAAPSARTGGGRPDPTVDLEK
ncbi:MAG TPA: tRNA lysidine(34) synthetase TilS [Candidatus Ruania gallistercoris]|uniref:tRNA(Ile)-lysidine synthase n=1 Tax=Candidatus Ruania gallistercoris TaxID=2838746 RepID=A0A9D2EDY0_9MICO|nr:tRNA lysidine(34) synthetase TilS [Candidatus Ruania gallistercoris]